MTMYSNQRNLHRTQREPRQHERLWNDRCVDKELKDEWLTALNAFKTIDLISICQGHVIERTNRIGNPHINIRIKSYFTADFKKNIDNPSLAMRVARLPDDTSWKYSYTYTEQINNGRPNMTSKIVFRFIRHGERNTAGMDKESTQWFERMISSISVLDELFLEALHENKL